MLFKRNVRLTARNIDTGETLIVEDLQVEFDIERTLYKEPSTLAATVYNLSEESRSFFETRDTVLLSLAAGYGDELHELFTGDLRIARHRRDGADIATDLEAGDGEKGSRKWANKWFPKDSRFIDIFRYLIAVAGIGEGNLSQAVEIEETNGLPDEIRAGWKVRGYALDQLHGLSISRGIDFSVQDNEAQFLRFDGVKQGVPVTVVTPQDGLIGSPTIDTEGVLSCEVMLLPDVFPGSQITVESEFVKGDFKVIRANYTGSVYGDDFQIALEGKAL